MGHLYIPAQKTITGPWLLDRKEIEELDEIFEFVDSKISESIDRDNVE
jgi:Ca2+-binding EF-hand superfamily protein